MADINYSEMFPLANDPTPYRKISDDFVSAAPFAGGEMLTIDPQALTLLTETAFHDIPITCGPAICGNWPTSSPIPKPPITTVSWPSSF